MRPKIIALHSVWLKQAKRSDTGGLKGSNTYVKAFGEEKGEPSIPFTHFRITAAIEPQQKRDNGEEAGDVDWRSNLKIFTIFNSRPLHHLSFIFYCKVNCLPNGH